MRTKLRGKISLLFLTIAVLLAVPAVAAIADTVAADADFVTTGNQAGSTANPIDLGKVKAGGFVERQVSFQLVCAGSRHVDQGQTVTLDATPGTTGVPLGGSLTATAATIGPIPASWPDDATSGGPNCPTPAPTPIEDNGNTTVKFTAPTNAADGAVYNFSVTWGGSDVTVSPLGNSDSNAVTGSTQVFFKVTVDAQAPTVTGAPTGTSEPIDTNVTASFSEAMDASTIADASGASTTFTLKKTSDDSAVGAAVSYNTADNKATLNPANDLAYSTQYTATVTTGAKDLVGNALASNQTWTFTTAAPPCTNPANPGFTNTPAASDWFNASTGIPTPNATTTTSGATVKYSLTENGTYSTTPPTLGQGETTVWAKAFSATGTCSSAAVSYLFKVDTIAPDVTPGNVVNSTWRNTDLSQAFTASDFPGSGLADPTNDANFTLTASAESANSSTPTVVERTVSDEAGNSTTRSVSAKIDKTPPTISATRNPADPAASGWYNISTGALKVSYTCNDALSGLDGTCPGVFTFGEGNNQSHSETISDQAGNQATSAVNDIKVDLTKPSVSVTGVTDGATYTTGNVPTPGCDTQDQPGLSGVKTDATVNVTGGTGGFGTLTATCSGAEDNAGNTNSASVKYNVKAAFNGFLQPIDGHSVNTGKFGRTYPIKWQLRDSSGALISDTAAQLLVGMMSGGQKAVSCTSFDLSDTDALEESTTGNTALRYDATSDQFIYNYKAPTSGTCYVFAIRYADGVTTQQIDFKFTK